MTASELFLKLPNYNIRHQQSAPYASNYQTTSLIGLSHQN
jgi:hypothetical protein